MVHSDYIKQRILFCRRSGKSYEGIVQSLAEEGHATSKAGVYKFIQCYEATGTIARVPGSSQSSKMTTEAVRIVEEHMGKDDKITGKVLQTLLAKDDITVASMTALSWQTELGWTSEPTSYCQMIRDANKEKRLEWAQKNKNMRHTAEHAATRKDRNQGTNQSRNILYKTHRVKLCKQ